MAATVVTKSGKVRKASQVAWEERNREERLQKMRDYYAANREGIRAQQETWRSENRERIQELNAAYYAANTERVKESVRLYQKSHPHVVKAARRRRKYRERGAGTQERYDRVSIFVRDNWTCQLCHAPVDPSLAYPDPMSASIDHTILLSRGGADTADNVRLAHLRCNKRRPRREVIGGDGCVS